MIPFPLVLRAPAKINLGLWITGPREDGYHHLLTLFQKVTLSDVLTIQPTEGPGIRVHCHPIGPQGQNNLVHHALQLLAEKTRRAFRIEVKIRKQIPIGAGLGGGSSDAGTALRAVGDVFQIPQSTLLEVARHVGADVPFFVVPWTTAIGKGLGDQLEAVSGIPRYQVLIAVPPLQISTAWAYRTLRKHGVYTHEQEADQRLRDTLVSLRRQDERGLRQSMTNDFERVIFREYPELQRLKDRLLEIGAMAAVLSGSGAAVFGLFPEGAHLQRLGLEGVREILTCFDTGQDQDDTRP